MIRFVFSKTGYTKFISHLDLTRCMSRIFSRAEIPLWYTQGFNPHAYMTFSPALSVGVEGLNELMDIKLDKPMDLDELLDRMNEASPRGIFFSDVRNSEQSLSLITHGVYSLTTDKETALRFSEFLEKDEIIVRKKTKRGDAEFDLKNEMSVIGPTNTASAVAFNITLPCSSERNISPLLLTDAFIGESRCDSGIDIMRLGFLDADGSPFLT